MYIVNGVDKATEFNGTVFTLITTGAPATADNRHMSLDTKSIWFWGSVIFANIGDRLTQTVMHQPEEQQK